MNSAQQYFSWLGESDAAIYSCLHLPTTARWRNTGIVICSPSGHEYTHTHGSFRYLAQRLADDAYPCMRFDYNGSGDSPGDTRLPKRIDCWLANIHTAITVLKQHSQVERIVLLGLRMGGTLAALYSSKTPVDYLILWNPCLNGASYVRDMQVLSEYHRACQRSDGAIDSGGFLITAETAAEYANINLSKLHYQVAKKLLLLNRDDVPISDRFATHLGAQSIDIETYAVPGYAAMMRQPELSVRPHSTLVLIHQWLNSQCTDFSATRSTVTPRLEQTLNSEQASWREHICRFGPQEKMLGLLCEPRVADARPYPLILISNTGGAHHVGPNRLHVELCRALAQAGYASFRCDLSNIGDSVYGLPENENHPYPANANRDLRAALDYLQSVHNYTRFIPAGLCSGANAAFHCALNNADLEIPEALLINPLIFYWRDGLSLATPDAVQTASDHRYYTQSLRDPRKWLKLLKGKANLRYILSFIIRHLHHRWHSALRYLGEVIGINQPGKLGADLLRYSNLRRHLSLFISAHDPGFDLLLSDARRITRNKMRRGELDVYFIADADHTFIAKPHRDTLIARCIHHLNTRYRSTT